jgi:hypothetical protein
MKTVYYRNVILDSESGSVRGDQLATKLNFPPYNFQARHGQLMGMRLSQFQMRRNFYNINETNNQFYLYDPAGAGTYTSIVIAPGDYTTMAALNTALTAAVNAAFVGSASTYDPITRKFTVTMAGTPPGSFLTCFQLKQSSPPAGITNDQAFQDVHEILGCRRTTDADFPTPTSAPVNSFGGVGPFVSPFAASLNSMECVYVRISLPTNNYQSVNFERDTPLSSNDVIPTQILARIPLIYPAGNPETDAAFITFDDPNNLFPILLDLQQLSTVEFFVTDDKGRPIQAVAPGQAAAGQLSYKMTIAWSLLEHEVPPASHKVSMPPPAHQNIALGYQ